MPLVDENVRCLLPNNANKDFRRKAEKVSLTRPGGIISPKKVISVSLDTLTVNDCGRIRTILQKHLTILTI